MQHVLNNPAYSALTTGNNALANGTADVKFFDADVCPFVGLKDNTSEQFKLLYQLLPHDNPVGFISLSNNAAIPEKWKILARVDCLQMVHDGAMPAPSTTIDVTDLRESHIPQMIALTQLTKPGPFAQRTIEFRHYQGVFDNGELVAMAGQRLHMGEYTEISAVCTHPAHTGKGYAAELMLRQIKRMKEASTIPILHVRQDNLRAIKVYERIGFTKRTDMFFYFIRKA